MIVKKGIDIPRTDNPSLLCSLLIVFILGCMALIFGILVKLYIIPAMLWFEKPGLPPKLVGIIIFSANFGFIYYLFRKLKE